MTRSVPVSSSCKSAEGPNSGLSGTRTNASGARRKNSTGASRQGQVPGGPTAEREGGAPGLAAGLGPFRPGGANGVKNWAPSRLGEGDTYKGEGCK